MKAHPCASRRHTDSAFPIAPARHQSIRSTSQGISSRKRQGTRVTPPSNHRLKSAATVQAIYPCKLVMRDLWTAATVSEFGQNSVLLVGMSRYLELQSNATFNFVVRGQTRLQFGGAVQSLVGCRGNRIPQRSDQRDQCGLGAYSLTFVRYS